MTSRLRAQWATIKTGYVGALTLYALIGPSFLHGLDNVVAVFGLLVLVPAAVIGHHEVTVRQRPSLAPAVFRPSEHSERALFKELQAVEHIPDATWWDPAHGRWFKDFFAFWWKETPVPAGSVSLLVDPDELSASRYSAVPTGKVQPAKPLRKKAVLLSMSPFLSDSDRALHCAPTDWELTQWVEQHLEDFRKQNPDVSAFGVKGRLPFPGLICVHTLLVTQDNWVIISLRSQHTSFFRESWSASFEEQVEIGHPVGAVQTDMALHDTIVRGLKEEFGSELSSFDLTTTCMAVGREYLVEKERGVLNCGVLATARLGAPLQVVWASLDKSGQVEDKSENAFWFAARFGSAREVDALLEATDGRRFSPETVRADHRLGVDINVYPHCNLPKGSAGTFPWHPTSQARLHLWAASSTTDL